ncbi:C6 zinc cluster transcription factor-like protein [Lecanicillium sp. MT-2017a]|nr:C6 zinc cluster transcription factor-like protein [Lecanicillium sp. MT-2017a]
MPLEKIYVVRHGVSFPVYAAPLPTRLDIRESEKAKSSLTSPFLQFRSHWVVDDKGNYRGAIPSPTGIDADPALTSHGVTQSRELGAHLATLSDPPIEAVYSSPYYRCLQTIMPYVSAQEAAAASGRLPASQAATTKIRPEAGFSEWFGAAPFEQPVPAEPYFLHHLFPAYDMGYATKVKPARRGETYLQLRDRITAALEGVIRQCDEEGVRGIVLCSHAAAVILMGRILTGEFPDEMDTEDFKAFTCGLSVYSRPQAAAAADDDAKVVGNWTCEKNSDCSFLSGGEERGWYV